MKRTIILIALLQLSPIIAGRDHSYFDMTFDKENRVIKFRDFINGDREQIIRHPAEYINCDTRIKRHIRGKLKTSDLEVAKNFPILDHTTFRVWYTDQKGNFDIEFPGNCRLTMGTFNKKGLGTTFIFIKEKENDFERDIILPSTAYLMSIAESIPDNLIESKLFSRYKSGDSWPPPTVPMTCVNGYLPKNTLDFHPFVVNLESREYFSGFDFNDKFEVNFSKTAKFVFIGYANKPRGYVSIFLIDPNPDPSKLAKKRNNCLQISLKFYKDATYDQLSQIDIVEAK